MLKAKKSGISSIFKLIIFVIVIILLFFLIKNKWDLNKAVADILGFFK